MQFNAKVARVRLRPGSYETLPVSIRLEADDQLPRLRLGENANVRRVGNLAKAGVPYDRIRDGATSCARPCP